MKRITRAAARTQGVIQSLEPRQLFAFGNLDPTFGTGGHVVATIKNQNITQYAEELTALAGGKVLAGGNAGLVKLNLDGTLDDTFGAQGKVRIRGLNFKAQAVNNTGQVFVLGKGSAGTIIAKYTAAGVLDASFGTAGTALVSKSTTFNPTSIALQADGKILVAGEAGSLKDQSQSTRVYRLTSDGDPDTSFGTNATRDLTLGKAPLLTPLLRDSVVSISVLSNGKIMLAGGSVAYSPSFSDNDGFNSQQNGDAMFVLAKLNSDGTSDGTYGSGGFVRSIYADADTVDAEASFNLDAVRVSAAAIKSDGTAVLGARDETVIVRQFNPTGGVVYSARPELGSAVNAAPSDLAFLSDGRVVAKLRGTFRFDLGQMIVPISPAGAFLAPVYANDLDKATPDVSNNTDSGFAIATDGKLVLAGYDDQAGRFAFSKYSAGKLSDPRPDEFANGTVNSIKKDSAGGLHVAYYDSTAKILKYVYRAPNGLWNAPVTVDSHARAGEYISLAINKDDQPGIAYFDGTNADLMFASTVDTGKNWAREVVTAKGSVGQYPSLLFDSKDRPTVTFYNLSTGDVIFGQQKINATTKVKSWGFEFVDSTGDVGREATLVVSTAGRFSVAYIDSTNKSIKWAAQNGGGVWETQTATETPGGARYLSMAYTDGAAPAISYFDPTDADLKMVYFASDNKWKTRLIAGNQSQGQWSKVLVSNSFSQPTVYAYNKTANEITRFVSIFDTPDTTTLATGGGQYLSVDNTGNVTDLAYVNTSDAKLRIRYGQGPA